MGELKSSFSIEPDNFLERLVCTIEVFVLDIRNRAFPLSSLVNAGSSELGSRVWSMQKTRELAEAQLEIQRLKSGRSASAN